MQKTWFVLVLAVVLSVGCGKKNNSDGGGGGGTPAQGSSVQELKVGEVGSPLSNSVSFGPEANPGALAIFNWKASRDGKIQVSPGGAIAINCSLNDVQPKVLLATAGAADVGLNIPQEIEVKSGVEYTVKLVFPANTCMSLGVDFSAVWATAGTTAPQPTPPPAPSRPVPQPEEGFNGESELTSLGGSIFVTDPKEASIYRDYYFEVTESQRFYINARAGGSSCSTSPETKLELLEIALDGTIAKRTTVDMGDFMTVQPGTFYRLRWSVSQIQGCYSVSESFNIGWL